MKKLIINDNSKENYSFLNSIEKYLNFYLLKGHYLTLSFDDINLKEYKSVSTFLKNIKTREIFKCISKIEDNRLIINLKNFNDLCTDYEFSLIVILEDNKFTTAIYPKLRPTLNVEESVISSVDNSNIQWYLRFLENGKLRLSTINLFSKIEKNESKKILL